jgi:hypothetical protein
MSINEFKNHIYCDGCYNGPEILKDLHLKNISYEVNTAILFVMGVFLNLLDYDKSSIIWS